MDLEEIGRLFDARDTMKKAADNIVGRKKDAIEGEFDKVVRQILERIDLKKGVYVEWIKHTLLWRGSVPLGDMLYETHDLTDMWGGYGKSFFSELAKDIDSVVKADNEIRATLEIITRRYRA